MTLIASIGPPIDVLQQTDASQRPDSYRVVLGGLQARPAAIRHDGFQEGIAIELAPTGSRALLGHPARALWDRSIELSDVTGRAGDELWERLQEAGTWAERFAICDEVLGRLASDAQATPPVDHAWRSLVRSWGAVAIGDLAGEIGWSRQRLTRRFTEEFGLRPKLAARVIRFERARRMLVRTPPYIGLAGVALACGYYDQAHLDRDFAELAGCTPTEWLREELPSFQDTESGEPEDPEYDSRDAIHDSNRLARTQLP
jgi:AraC-like DNA-binding protein